MGEAHVSPTVPSPAARLDLDLAFCADPDLSPELQAATGPWCGAPEPAEAAWREQLSEWLTRLQAELPQALRHSSYCLGLSLVSDAGIASLNAEWRGKAGPTDVLAFAAQEEAAQEPIEAAIPPFPYPPQPSGRRDQASSIDGKLAAASALHELEARHQFNTRHDLHALPELPELHEAPAQPPQAHAQEALAAQEESEPEDPERLDREESSRDEPEAEEPESEKLEELEPEDFAFEERDPEDLDDRDDRPEPGELGALAAALESEPLELGDIVISLETAARQAAEQGHTLEHELLFLASHGLLHLLGWDHPDEASLTAMLARQEALLQGA